MPGERNSPKKIPLAYSFSQSHQGSNCKSIKVLFPYHHHPVLSRTLGFCKFCENTTYGLPASGPTLSPFFPEKSCRQAHGGYTWNAPCSADFVQVLSVPEALRSGADNADTIYRRPAN
ncbi:hypothetical protein DFH06DRAFT_1329179 [Mycena polygramma]|nr:hypothetical protein DFH06DRAFT_1329179 [Mycena polygramma]